MVVVSGAGKKTLARLGTAQNYFAQDSLPGSCVQYAFGARKGSAKFRYPSTGNVQFGPGCSGQSFVADASAQSCACDNGICFQGTCETFEGTLPPVSAAASVLLSAVLLCVAAFVLML